MQEFLQDLASPYWILSVLVVGILINILSAPFGNKLDELVKTKFPSWREKRSEKRQAIREEDLETMRLSARYRDYQLSYLILNSVLSIFSSLSGIFTLLIAFQMDIKYVTIFLSAIGTFSLILSIGRMRTVVNIVSLFAALSLGEIKDHYLGLGSQLIEALKESGKLSSHQAAILEVVEELNRQGDEGLEVSTQLLEFLNNLPDKKPDADKDESETDTEE